MQSMTGYGQARIKGRGFTLEVEIQSYNHRFLEVKVKLPSEYMSLEREIIEHVSAGIQRGWITVMVSLQVSPERASIQINQKLAGQYWNALRKLRRGLKLEREFNPEVLTRLPGVFEVSSGQPAPKEVKEELFGGLDLSLRRLIKMRAREGGRLLAVMNKHLKKLQAAGRSARAMVPRSRPGGGKPSNADKAARPEEAAAGRFNVEEELNRLESHLRHLRNTLDKRPPVGKILEFILREVLREVTTLGDKAGVAAISDQVVLMKTEIENLREQARNVE